MQAPNPRTPSLLGFTTTQASMLVILRSHSKVSNHPQLLIFVAVTSFYHRLIIDLALADALRSHKELYVFRPLKTQVI